MFESKKDRERKATRERVKRYRERKAKQEGVTPVTGGVTATKMVCKCQYYQMVKGVLICSQCGKPATPKKPEDKIRHGLEFK
jgi:hypothetical protein